MGLQLLHSLMGKTEELSSVAHAEMKSLGKGTHRLFHRVLSACQFLVRSFPRFALTLKPPHFHALYAEHEAVIDLRDLSVIRGSLAETSDGPWSLNGRDSIRQN